MIKKMAWDAFKKTGDINTFLEYKQIENIENNMKETEKIEIDILNNEIINNQNITNI